MKLRKLLVTGQLDDCGTNAFVFVNVFAELFAKNR